MMQPGDVAALSAFAEAARQIRLPFFVVGSVASSLHGIPRMTQDVDVVALLRRDHIGGLCAALGTDWYAAEEAMEEALRFRSSFNAIHYPSGVKIDVFVGGHRP